jgi:hypothetical protein
MFGSELSRPIRWMLWVIDWSLVLHQKHAGYGP